MSDPYLNISNCVERLYNEYKKHKRLVIATDFDDTCFPYHNKENTHKRVLDLLHRCQEKNFYIVCFTASLPVRYTMIQEFFKKEGITISGINQNPVPLPFGNHGKIYYNILLDDRAGLNSAVDTLETLLFLIDKEPKPEYIADTNPTSISDCSEILCKAGMSYPRTCKICGLGPCNPQKYKTI
jgi:hypothetical protein